MGDLTKKEKLYCQLYLYPFIEKGDPYKTTYESPLTAKLIF